MQTDWAQLILAGPDKNTPSYFSLFQPFRNVNKCYQKLSRVLHERVSECMLETADLWVGRDNHGITVVIIVELLPVTSVLMWTQKGFVLSVLEMSPSVGHLGTSVFCENNFFLSLVGLWECNVKCWSLLLFCFPFWYSLGLWTWNVFISVGTKCWYKYRHIHSYIYIYFFFS